MNLKVLKLFDSIKKLYEHTKLIGKTTPASKHLQKCDGFLLLFRIIIEPNPK